MCILFLALGQHPQYPLIVAANRDEEFSRPSQSAGFWKDEPTIYGGRDLKAGGTWLAVNRSGLFSAITNLREPSLYRDDAESRGHLIPEYLCSQSLPKFRQTLQNNRLNYNPYNLIFGSIGELTVFNSVKNSFTCLEKGFHSVSNGPVDDYWPKMSRGVSLLEAHVKSRVNQDLDINALFADMLDTTQADESVLPETGIGLEVEKHLSSIFISGDSYGTRTTSILVFDGKQLHFHERDYGPFAKLQRENTQQINIAPMA